MKYYVIEIEFGEVISIKEFDDFILAEEYAQTLCEEEGIDFEGDISHEGLCEYSIQIMTKV